MKSLLKYTAKNCLSVLFIVLIAMMFFVTNSNAQDRARTVLQVKAAIEGLYDESNGNSASDAQVLVYLRNSEPPYNTIDVAKGFIDKMTLTGSFTFMNVRTGQYYIVLKSKNTIETWSRKGGELLVNGTKTMYDFTTGKEKAFGDNMKHNGKHASIYTGDVNVDGFVDKYDLVAIEEDMHKVKGNVPTDLNGDEEVTEKDYNIAYTNFENTVQAITPVNLESTLDKFDASLLTVQIKAVIEGLINLRNGTLEKDALVTAYLRNIEPPYEIVAEAAGFLDKETFKGTFNFWRVNAGQYYVVLKSGNSVETWSRKGGEKITSGIKHLYDFTTGKDKAFAENMILIGKLACIYSGDVNQDGFVDKYDITAVENDMYKIKGDVVTDLNGDEVVDKLDYDIVYNNFKSKVQAMTPENNLSPLSEKIAEEAFTLSQNHPNPFNPSTQITFTVPGTSNVMLSIYDMSGREVAQLVNGVLGPGSHTYEWNASNFASGTYFYRINVNGYEQTVKMQLVK